MPRVINSKGAKEKAGIKDDDEGKGNGTAKPKFTYEQEQANQVVAV